jgi:beta-phosphoglucomutase
MNKKAFIFDLDGVIVDTAKYHFLAWKKLANSIGVDFTEVQNEQLKGVSRVKSLEKILVWGNKSISEDEFVELMALKNEDYLSYINKMDDNEILPDVTKILDFLKENKQYIALGSASKNARMILKKVNILDKFEVIVDGNDVTKAKPNPEVFLKAAKHLDCEPKNCIVFEDSVAGVKAANIASMVSIGIGDKETLKEADYVFNDFTEITKEFLNELIKEKRT